MILPVLLLVAALLRPVRLPRRPDQWPILRAIAAEQLDDYTWRARQRRVLDVAEACGEAHRQLAAIREARRIASSLRQPSGSRPADPRSVWPVMGQPPRLVAVAA